MIFREFVAETLDAVAMLAATNAGDRDLTPMVHLQTPDGRREIVAVDHRFFAAPGAVEQLVGGFVVPLVLEHAATKVAWTFTSALEDHDDALRIVVAVVMDAEVHEVWIAQITPLQFRPDRPTVGDWLELGANSTYGPMVGPVQEALR